MKKRLRHLIRHGRDFAKEQIHKQPAEEHDDVRITNETVAARREEVLGSARKYIYPLQASKHRIVKLSVGILIATAVGFSSFCLLELYKFQATSSFIYGVTQVVPLPVAVIDHRYLVSYSDYLFELRHYMHYYQTQLHVDFNDAAGKQQLAVYKERSLDQVLQNAYVQRLAEVHHVSVSEHEVDVAITLVRTQNRLGANDQVFQSVLSEFWGWSVADFKRELRQELLAQKVVDALDTRTHERADQALAQLQHGADFAKLAKKVSDDTTTRGNGGDYGILIDRSNSDIAPQIIDELFKLKPGQYSDVINTGYSLEIVRVTAVQGTKLRAAHIVFKLKPVTTYTLPLEAKQKPTRLIHV